MSPKQKVEPLLVESAFLPDGKQVCIWSDGEAFLVDKDTGDSPIGIRKARNLISKARNAHRSDYAGCVPDEDGALGYVEDD